MESHRAWTFEPVEFHRWLERSVIENDALRLDRLEKLARRGIAEARGAAQGYLDAIGCAGTDDDIEAFFASGEDADRSSGWYGIVLASYVEDAPALSAPWLMQHFLQQLGWSVEAAQDLVDGSHTLAALAASSGNPLIANQFRFARLRGWTPVVDAQRILGRLHTTQSSFQSPPVQLVQFYGVEKQATTIRNLQKVFRESVAMLETALQRNRDLMIVHRT
jgi:hypothetical protein